MATPTGRRDDHPGALAPTSDTGPPAALAAPPPPAAPPLAPSPATPANGAATPELGVAGWLARVTGRAPAGTAPPGPAGGSRFSAGWTGLRLPFRVSEERGGARAHARGHPPDPTLPHFS